MKKKVPRLEGYHLFLGEENRPVFRIDKPMDRNKIDKGTDNLPLFNQSSEDPEQINLFNNEVQNAGR
jgi:hypothetical protein